MSIILEVCVDSPAGLEAAIQGGADRIELCSALDLGGLTPSPGLIAIARQAPIPVYAMIRPRAGNFCFSGVEETVMLAEIDAVRQAGLAGIVIGAALPDNNLDVALLSRLVSRAGNLGITVHRVFDLVPDMDKSLQEVVLLGAERILTSGSALTAAEGLTALKHLTAQAAGNVSIMPGSGVNSDNALHILKQTGAREIHASCREPLRTDNAKYIEFGFSPECAFVTSQVKVQQMKAIVSGFL